MKLPIRALLLAAGFGTRLRPLTLNTPKCLVSISNKPLLHIWLDKLVNLGCKSTLINTHYLSDQVNSSIREYDNSKINIYTTYEKTLLGTAGTLMVNRDFFRGSLGLIIHADNITNDNLEELIDTHVNKSKDSLLTMLTFKTDNPSQCGIVETNEKGVVTAFHEKTKNPPGFIANGAIYAFDQSFLDFLDQTHFSGQDISKDLLPKLLGRIQTCYSQTTFLDIGSPTTLSRAQELWKKESLNE